MSYRITRFWRNTFPIVYSFKTRDHIVLSYRDETCLSSLDGTYEARVGQTSISSATYQTLGRTEVWIPTDTVSGALATKLVAA